MGENKIICGDCLEVMRDMPDNSVDLVLTDPPYGIGNNITYRKNQCSKRARSKDYGAYKWNNEIPSKQIFSEILRTGEDQVIWGGNYFLDYGLLKATPAWLVWDKKNDTSSFAKCELAWTSYAHAIKIYRYLWNGMLQENMGSKEVRYHPTQKPLELMEWCIENYSKPNDLIFDPFCGSGTTCVAAKRLGRRYIGIDISEEYCDIARKRLEAEEKGITVKELEKGQGSLFK